MTDDYRAWRIIRYRLWRAWQRTRWCFTTMWGVLLGTETPNEKSQSWFTTSNSSSDDPDQT